jgi:hypothetical protein
MMGVCKDAFVANLFAISFWVCIGATGPGGPEFTSYKDHVSSEHGVQFLMSLSDLPTNDGTPRLALISGRTADNPKLLSQAMQVRIITTHWSLCTAAVFST